MIFSVRYTIYNIRLGRNVKCLCDDCCGLRNLSKRFEEEGRPVEAAIATKALRQHKRRADFKQTRYRVSRANAAASCSNGRVNEVSTQFPRSNISIKLEDTHQQITPNPTESLLIAETCTCPISMSINSIQEASYTQLVNEVQRHGIKCRKDKQAMKEVLEHHYVQMHGEKPIRAMKRKSMSFVPSVKRVKHR